MTEMDAEAREHWRRLTELADTIARAEAEAKHVKELLRKLLGGGRFSVDGEDVLALSPARRFNADRAIQALQPAEAIACMRYTVDAKAVRARFSEATAEEFMEDGTTRVVLL